LVLLINVYPLSSKKLEIRAKQFLLRNEGVGSRGRWWGKGGGKGKRGGGGKGGEMAQTLYAHMNKRKFKKW
jgi:hypothetical protein